MSSLEFVFEIKFRDFSDTFNKKNVRKLMWKPYFDDNQYIFILFSVHIFLIFAVLVV